MIVQPSTQRLRLGVGCLYAQPYPLWLKATEVAGRVLVSQPRRALHLLILAIAAISAIGVVLS
jgi:hypothetical protein